MTDQTFDSTKAEAFAAQMLGIFNSSALALTISISKNFTLSLRRDTASEISRTNR